MVEVRLADGLGGKGIVYVTGKVEEVEVAVEAGVAVAEASAKTRSVVIPAQHAELQKQIKESSRFER